MTRRLLPLLLCALALASPAGAQAVSGRFVDQDGTPIPSARVTLQAESGAAVHAVLTGADGQFSLRAPAAGRYLLRAERIGYAATVSAPMTLAAGETATQRLVAAGQRVMLESVVVSAQPRCSIRPGDAEETAAVWGEVRKALDVVSATSGETRAQFAVELFERQLDATSGSVTEDTRRRVQGMAQKPFVTVDPERLSTTGFVERTRDGYLYAAPDADVLLSDLFLEGHCFRLRSAGAPAAGLIGLAFEPVRGRRVSDVQGVLWVDRASAELRLMEFEYTRPPVRGRAGVPGGRMEFQRLPDGRWITSAWVIRMPVEAPRAQTNVLVPATRQMAAIREVGGAVQRPGTATLAAATPPAAPDPRASIAMETPAAAPGTPAPAAPEAASTVIEARPEAERQSDRRRLIGRAEVERTIVGTAFELVQSLRPQWMRARGSDAMSMTPIATRDGPAMAINDENPIMVWVDGRRLGTLETLRTISYGEIDYIEYFDGTEAQQRFGAGNAQGAIHVVRRRR
ncbi:carboxypeptidase-like regulatory domain-containing protein [Longimicrobium sp.]|uniref:carboxypeptidase-like regulatory domain-containing protein n=1 Tax=Longimicrobium sp. TaxID=2029185 RepID=UPI003B3B15F7